MIQVYFRRREKGNHFLQKVVERGLEPRTLGLLDPRSNQLSYTTYCASFAYTVNSILHYRIIIFNVKDIEIMSLYIVN